MYAYSPYNTLHNRQDAERKTKGLYTDELKRIGYA